MAIAFGNTSTGIKSATTGTSFAIAVNSTAGSQVLICVATNTNVVNVTSVTDTGGNVYSRITSNTLGASSLNLEIWGTNKAHAAASGTVTVNVTTGFLALGIGVYYSGMDLWDFQASSTGTTSPLTSGSVTLKDRAEWIMTYGACNAANTWTASSGSLRNQGSQTGLANVLIDSNGAASPATDSATMTAATWGQITLFLRFATGAMYYVPGRNELPRIPPGPLNYAKPDFAYGVKSLPYSSPSSARTAQNISSGTGERKDHFDSFVAPLLHVTAVLPSLGFDLSKTPSFLKSYAYSRAEEDLNPGTAITFPTISGWLPNIGQQSILLDYALPDYVGSPYPVVAVPPVPSIGYLPYDANKNLPQSYARPDFVGQVYPSRVLTPLGYLPYDANKILPQKYLVDDFYVRPPTVPFVPAISGWFGTDGRPAVRNIYASPDFVGQLFPTLATLPILRALAELPNQRVENRYAPSDFVNQLFPTKVLTSLAFAYQPDAGKALWLNYAQPDYVRSPYPIVAPPSISSWLSTIGQNAQPQRFAITDFVNQIFPTLAQLPRLSQLAEPGISAQPQHYAIPAFDAPPKFGLVIAAPLQLPGWLSTIGQNAVMLKYAPSDFVTQVGPTLATLPFLSWLDDRSWSAFNKFQQIETVRPIQVAIALPSLVSDLLRTMPVFRASAYIQSREDINLGPLPLPSLGYDLSWTPAITMVSAYAQSEEDLNPGEFFPVFTINNWLSTDGQTSIILRYAPSDDFTKLFVQPSIFFAISGWLSTIGQNAQPQHFAATDFVNQIFPTLAQLPRLSQLAEPGINAQPSRYAIPAFDAPPKFGLIIAAPLQLSGWLSTIGQNAVRLNYASPDFVTQVRPTLATLPFISWLDDKPWSVFNRFQQIETVRPTQVIAAPLPFVSWLDDKSWSTFGKYQQIETVRPTQVVVTLPFISWLDDKPWSAFGKFQQIETVRPIFFAPPVFYAPMFQQLIPNAANPFWKQSDFINQIYPTLATLPRLLSNIADPGIHALPQMYAAPTWDAPPKFGLTVASLQTVAGWSGTMGEKSVVLKYAPSDFVNQIFPTLAMLPRLLSGIADPGVHALPQMFAVSAFDAPPKFGLTIASLQTIAGLLSTIGEHAVTLKYLQSDFLNQIRPTLGTLPFLLSELTKPADPVVLLRYASPDWVSRVFSSPPLSAAVEMTPTTRPGNPPTFLPGDIFKAPEKVFPPAPSIAGWTSTIGASAVQYRFSPPEFVSQVRPTLVTLPSSTSYLAFIPPKAQPQKFAAPDWWVSQYKPTLERLPLILEGLAFIAPHAQPQHYAVPELTAPAKWVIIVPPTAIISRGVIFYKVIAEMTEVYQMRNQDVIMYKVYAITTNLQQKLVRIVAVDKVTGRILYIQEIAGH